MKSVVRSWTVALLGLGLLGGPVAAQQADSALAVSRGGNSLFRVNVDGSAVFGGTHTDGNPSMIPREGSGTRMFWYPGKSAFRAGTIDGTQWDDANVGLYSTAFGFNARALGDYSLAVGRRATAANTGTVAIGEDVTATGANSIAFGYKASTSTNAGSPRLGTFVFGDRSNLVDTIHAELTNSATFRVANGYRIYTAANKSTGFHILPNMNGSFDWSFCSHSAAAISTSTCGWLSSGGVWVNSSDVRRKHLFEDVGGEFVLAQLRNMPIRSWSYRAEPESTRHLGPTAQDFRTAFGLGNDETSIATVDADGVSLAAAKALERRTAEQAEEIRALKAKNEELEARLARLEAILRNSSP